MSEHSKYTDGKVLRAKGAQLTITDAMMLLRGLEGAGGHTLDDLRRMDSVRAKVNEALEAEAPDFYNAYTNAVNSVEAEIIEKGIVNGMAVLMLRETALRPVMLDPAYADTPAPDVYLSLADWSWAQKKWRSRENLAADADNTRRTLRIADVLDGALGYKNKPDKTVAIEGEDDGERPALKAV